MKASLLKVTILLLVFFSLHTVYSKPRNDFVKELEPKYPTKAIDSLFSTTIESENFLIHFKKTYCSTELAKHFALTAEYVKEKYISWGFQEPPSMRRRFSIYIVPEGTLEKTHTGHYVHGGHTTVQIQKLWQNPIIEITIAANHFDDTPLEISWYFPTIAHEIFHAFQYGYSTNTTSWFKESTAETANIEITDEIDEHFELPYATNTYINNWHEKGFFDETMEIYKYDSSLFFLYLLRNYKDGPYQGTDILKKLWELKPQRDQKSLGYIEEILGGKKNFEEAFHRYAAFFIQKSDGTGKPKNISALSDIKQSLDKTMPGHYITSFKKDTGSIKPRKYTIKPLRNLYLSFIPFPISETFSRFSFGIVKKNEKLQVKPFLIKKLKTIILPQIKNDSFEVESINDSLDEIIVVITNPTEEDADIEISAAFGAPPFIRKVDAYDEKNNLIYSAEWVKSSGEGTDWQWELATNKNELSPGENASQNLKFKIFTSNKLEGNLTLETSKKIPLKFSGEEEFYGYIYEGSAQFNVQKDQKELVLAFSGIDLKDNQLDANPKTKPYFNKVFETVYWENYEGGENERPIGGIDRTYKIKIGGAEGEVCGELFKKMEKVKRE